MTKTTTYMFEDDGSIPNNQELPFVLYQQVLEEGARSRGVIQLLGDHGWSGAWVNGIYSYHHYHSTAHEVLAVIGGYAKVQFGGKQGEILDVETGDVVVIPAGVGHCRLSSSADFQVVGAYPDGQRWDMCTGKPGERPQVLENIRSVSLPDADPVTGEQEPLLGYWRQ